MSGDPTRLKRRVVQSDPRTRKRPTEATRGLALWAADCWGKTTRPRVARGFDNGVRCYDASVALWAGEALIPATCDHAWEAAASARELGTMIQAMLIAQQLADVGGALRA